MIDLFPSLYATLKADAYFATTLAGFADKAGRFKVFKGDESPTGETPFVTIDIDPGPQDQNNAWGAPQASFHCHGTDRDWALLYATAEAIRAIFLASGAYTVVGSPDFGEGRNPVTEQVTVSVAIRFGMVN